MLKDKMRIFCIFDYFEATKSISVLDPVSSLSYFLTFSQKKKEKKEKKNLFKMTKPTIILPYAKSQKVKYYTI